MGLTSIGDQSRMFLSQRLGARLRGDLERLTKELSTERRQTAGTPATGDLVQLLGLRREMSALNAYKTAAAEAQISTKTAATVLERVSKAASEASVGMVAAGLSRSGAEIIAAAEDARVRFISLVDGLNARAGGISLFAGVATDRPALADASQILAALEAATAGATDAASLRLALTSWFADTGGGYETMALQGSDQPPTYRISPGENVPLPVTAAVPALRQAFLGLAMAAFAPKLADIGEQSALMGAAGTHLIEVGTDIIALRAELGATEARLATRATQIASEHSALQLAEAKLTGVDPYDTAANLEATAMRLETLYTVTARLSRLSLSEYLR